jgi:hypothetical protein
MHLTRASSRPSAPALVGALLVALAALLAHGPALAQQRARAIVLSFEGWRAEQARTAVADALSQEYELVTEDQAINAAAQIAADVSTPEGMAAVVQHLGIELVVGGSVSGTGRRSSTSIFVLDRNGNEIGSGTGPGPTGRAAAGPIGAAALQACATAMATLHPPQPVEPVMTPEETPPEEDPGRSLEEIENERPGESRGQRGGDRRRDDDEGGGGPTARWNQPVFRGALMLDIRNRAAVLTPTNADPRCGGAGCASPGNFADFYPQLGLMLETRPLAQQDDALRGLYARLDLGFSAGISYFADNALLYPLQAFNVEVNVGYAGTIAEVVELIGSIGFGYDMVQLTSPWTVEPAEPTSDRDLPSTAYPYLPILAGGRVRLLPSSVEGVDLHLEAMAGPRILFGGGEISQTAAESAYFDPRSGTACGNGVGSCDGDFGGVSGVGINFFAGLGVIIDPGITAALRFQYVNYFMSFAEGSGTRQMTSGIDESLHIQILAGYSYR